MQEEADIELRKKIQEEEEQKLADKKVRLRRKIEKRKRREKRE